MVENITFGVEIETCVPLTAAVSIGGYHHGIEVPQLPVGWTAQRDGSISAPTGYTGCEFVSPVLKGADGVRQLLQVVAWLNEIGAKVNTSCGIHVHVGWNGDALPLDTLVFLAACHEKALFAATGTRTRERGNFCKSIQENAQYVDRFANKLGNVEIYSRYHTLNLTNLRKVDGRRTVEFRVFSGSLNIKKILGYVRLSLAIVEKALTTKRRPKWIAKEVVATSPIYRKGGLGQTALTRLFYAIGWTKGRETHTFGDVTCDGAPSHESIKRELMRLAKKYDGEN